MTWLSELPTAILPKCKLEDDGDNICWPADAGIVVMEKIKMRAKNETYVRLDWGKFIVSV